jgi:hypothetical protein
MAKRIARRELPYPIQRAVETVLDALDGRDRQLTAWEVDADRRPRGDHADGVTQIHDSAARTITTAGANVDAEIARIAKEYAKHRRSNYDATEVESAWRRVRELLDSGFEIDDIIASHVLDRATAEAVRRNFPAWQLAKMPGDIEGAKTEAERIADDALRAELPYMDRAERDATEAELGAHFGQQAIEALSRFMASARDPHATIRLGHDLSDAGFVPPPPVVEPLAEAQRARNSLPPELRDALDGNARDVGWSAEPSLTLGGR